MIGLQVVARDFEEEQAVDGLGEEEEEERKVSATAVTGGASFIFYPSRADNQTETQQSHVPSLSTEQCTRCLL